MNTPQSYETNLKQEGTARDARFLEPLNPDRILLDDRKLEDYLAYAQQYTSNILFVSTESATTPAVAWDSFYRNEPAFMMARIAIKKPSEIKEVYDLLLSRFEEDISINNFEKVVSFVFARFEKIDRWYASLENDPLQDELALYIRSYLASEFAKFRDILLYVHTRQQDKRSFSEKYALRNKNNVWELSDEMPRSINDEAFAGNNEAEKLTNASIVVNSVFENLFHTTCAVINYCKNYFQTTIFQQQNHKPHVALFIAFIKLYGYQQEQLNKLPGRLLQYYYQDVLQIRPKKAAPDKTIILFEITKGFDHYLIPKGTLLTAGKDRTNKELLYKTDRSIEVNKASVQTIKTVQVLRKNDKVFNIYADTIKGKNETLQGIPHKFFGETDLPAQIGFAIASTQFYLAKGERNVSVVLKVKDDIARDSFDTTLIGLKFTGEEGWIHSRNPKDYITIHSLKKGGEKTIELNFSISIAQPSGVVAFDPAVHDSNFQTRLPVMQLLLHFPSFRQESIDPLYETRIEQLNELLSLQVLAATINVRVGSISLPVSFNGVTDLLLENHESVLDAGKPFYPFTAMPKVGSSFYIGCSDLYYKSVQRFSVNIEWMLPDNFRNYYEKYFPPYDTNRFMATLSILQGRKWRKISDESIIDTNEEDGKFRALRVNLEALQPTANSEAEKNISKFDTTKQDGTLRLKLLYPDFGHDIYPQLITSTVLEKSSSKSATVDFYKIVKKQLYDSVISIKAPENSTDRMGPFKEVFDILEKVDKEQQARTMLVRRFTDVLKKVNDTNIESDQFKELASRAAFGEDGENLAVVNDDRFISRLLYFLKKIQLIDNSIHFDRDRQDVEDVALDLKEKMNTRASQMLPAHWELASLIISEINSAINRIVVRITDEILMRRKTAAPDAAFVSSVTQNHIAEANEVINDMIARKIAILLSANDIPPKPYTPLINTIAINYVSTKELNAKEDQLFHILPFGVSEINPFDLNVRKQNKGFFTDRLFPFAKEAGTTPEPVAERQFYLGLSDLGSSSNLTLFFHLAEGSRKNDKKPPPLQWWCLRQNQWHRLEDQSLISDTTFGLQNSGIIQLSLPHDLEADTAAFDEKKLSWLCVSTSGDADSFPNFIDVQTQAVPVTLEDNSNDPEHFAMPLPPEKIRKLVTAMPGVKSVRQPIASLHGRKEEGKKEYYTRVSERLRHKNRAVNSWDYERLVLEEFPYIYKVNCINNYCRNKYAHGHVTVVPVVDLKNKGEALASHPPRASYKDLRDIEVFLAGKTPPFVKVHAVNPEIQYVMIRGKVRLRNDRDKGFYLDRLNEELVRFLTPWAATDTDAFSFSAKLYLSSIISFIDEREYVKYVTNIEMNQYKLNDQGEKVFSKSANGILSLFETVPIAPHEILASAPAHAIEFM